MSKWHLNSVLLKTGGSGEREQWGVVGRDEEASREERERWSWLEGLFEVKRIQDLKSSRRGWFHSSQTTHGWMESCIQTSALHWTTLDQTQPLPKVWTRDCICLKYKLNWGMTLQNATPTVDWGMLRVAKNSVEVEKGRDTVQEERSTEEAEPSTSKDFLSEWQRDLAKPWTLVQSIYLPLSRSQTIAFGKRSGLWGSTIKAWVVDLISSLYSSIISNRRQAETENAMGVGSGLGVWKQ